MPARDFDTRAQSIMTIQKILVCRWVIVVGNLLTAIGCLGLVLGATGVIQLDLFAVGISSGVRVIGSVAIAGCLLSAIGYGVVEYLDK